jgi:hypothetical protein
MWFVVPALIGIGAYVVAQEYPLFGYAVLVICGGTVLISALSSPAAGVSYLFLALMIVGLLVLLRFIFPIVMWLIGGVIGLMFFYYVMIGLGQLAGGGV